MRERTGLVEKDNPKISMRRQCELLVVARSTVDYVPVPKDPEDLLIKRLLDEIYLKDPCLGSRRLVTILERDYDRACPCPLPPWQEAGGRGQGHRFFVMVADTFLIPGVFVKACYSGLVPAAGRGAGSGRAGGASSTVLKR